MSSLARLRRIGIRRLHVFANEVTDWVIAYDPADAIKVWEETVGDTYIVDEYGGEFIQVPGDKKLCFFEEKTLTPSVVPAGAELIEESEFCHTYKATCRAWADARGRCFLGSTEY